MSSADNPTERIADLVLGIYQIHAEVLAQTGGLDGLRDAHMLHAAGLHPDQPKLSVSDIADWFHNLIR